MQRAPLSDEELENRAWDIYQNQIRSHLETEENIGKIVVIDVDTGDYEMDEIGIESSLRLQARHPESVNLFAIRVGYKTTASFNGELERTAP